MMYLKCGRCGLKTIYGTGQHELHEYDVCGACYSELDGELERMAEEEEAQEKEEESWKID